MQMQKEQKKVNLSIIKILMTLNIILRASHFKFFSSLGEIAFLLVSVSLAVCLAFCLEFDTPYVLAF